MSAILMVKCTGGHFLVDIDDAKEKRQENCLTDGSAFCDAQSPCCDDSSCVLIGMITQCAKKNSEFCTTDEDCGVGFHCSNLTRENTCQGNGIYDCDIDEINKNKNCDPPCLPGSCLDESTKDKCVNIDNAICKKA